MSPLSGNEFSQPTHAEHIRFAQCQLHEVSVRPSSEILRFAQDDSGLVPQDDTGLVPQVLLKVSPKMETSQQQRSLFHPEWYTFGA